MCITPLLQNKLCSLYSYRKIIEEYPPSHIFIVTVSRRLRKGGGGGLFLFYCFFCVFFLHCFNFYHKFIVLQFRKKEGGGSEDSTTSKCYRVRDKKHPGDNERNETAPPSPLSYSLTSAQAVLYSWPNLDHKVFSSVCWLLPTFQRSHTSVDPYHTATVLASQLALWVSKSTDPTDHPALLDVSRGMALPRCTKDPQAPWRLW